MVGIITTAALFCWTNVQDCENTSSWYSGCYFDTPPLVSLYISFTFPFSHRPWDADILSCACSFMFTADSMRGTSLDDTRIFRPVMRKQRCKVFLEYGVQTPPQPKDPPPNPSTREGSIIYCLMWALVSCNYSLPLWEGWGGVLGLGAAEVIRGAKAYSSFYFTPSHSKSL